jgi:hypothetical protein
MYNISHISLEIMYSKKFYEVQKVMFMTVATAVCGGAAIESIFKTTGSSYGQLWLR